MKDNTHSIILISGFVRRGKTTFFMHLRSAIACDRELDLMFSELQNRIIYFDSVNDKDALLDYLSHVGKPKCKLIIIDNIHKYTISSINEIMSRVNNFALHNQTTEKRTLIVFLYQETSKNEALYEYVRNKFFKDKNNIFKLNQYVNFEGDDSQKYSLLQAEEFWGYINKIEDSFFRQYMKNIFYNSKDDSVITLLMDLVLKQPSTVPSNKEKIFFVLIIAIFLGLYNGYATKKDLHFLWKENYSLFSLPQEDLLIKYYVHNRILAPFLFISCAYIFN